jgi:uncharacterized membrane protein YdjX (TVP38/TMEM64 family)
LDLTIEEINRWMDVYRNVGPVIAFLLPFIEAFLPVLPLFAIVTGNAAAFGLWPGFLFTWLGACAGSLLVFILVRKVGARWTPVIRTKLPMVIQSSAWFEQHGFTILFLLRCFPFSPSSLINVLAGLSTISVWTYFWATVLGKAVMVLILSVIGHDLPAMLREPWKLGVTLILILAIWMIGRKVEQHYLLKT